MVLTVCEIPAQNVIGNLAIGSTGTLAAFHNQRFCWMEINPTTSFPGSFIPGKKDPLSSLAPFGVGRWKTLGTRLINPAHWSSDSFKSCDEKAYSLCETKENVSTKQTSFPEEYVVYSHACRFCRFCEAQGKIGAKTELNSPTNASVYRYVRHFC